METNYKKLDWTMICLYLALVFFGWMNIYSSSAVEGLSIFDLSTKYGMHLIWIGTSLLLAAAILFVIKPKVYPPISVPLYLFVAVLLLAVAFIGVEVNGSKSWFAIGPFRLQPAEFSKISTSLLLATVMSKFNFSFSNRKDVVRSALIIILPILFILMEKETGSALVYLGFLLAFYREGMTGWLLVAGLLCILFFILTLVTDPYITIIVLMGIITAFGAAYSKKHFKYILFGCLSIAAAIFLPKLLALEKVASFVKDFSLGEILAIITAIIAIVLLAIALLHHHQVLRNTMLGFLCGIAIIFSVEFFFEHVLQDHQRARIEVLLGIKEDPMGVGYNVHQSLIAIGSGGFAGKGFLHGTQTRFDFVPEQSTDFIFCTIGEEWGFLGTIATLAVYLALIIRILNSAEKQKDKFTRIYGYCVASCLLMHVFINVSMTIGLMPVIGIPLPFISYGGSSLWAFTILLFIYIRLDLVRWNKY